MTPMNIIDDLYLDNFHPACDYARENGMRLVSSAHRLSIVNYKKNQIIHLRLDHVHYVGEFVRMFDYYFNSVEPVQYTDYAVVDFSVSGYHDVVGYDHHPIHFPTIAEPIVTTNQYLSFAELSEGKVVFDLGAYSGLTSILFKDLVGKTGSVVAVEADLENIQSIKKNFKLYKTITGNDIDLLYGAAWNHNDGLSFSREGSMGSSATEIVGAGRGVNALVPSYTLSQIAEVLKVTQVDFIKCDIEAAEEVLFEDAEFFKKYRPRIIVEVHNNKDGEMTTNKVIADLTASNYQHKIIEQYGVHLPLVQFIPL